MTLMCFFDEIKLSLLLMNVNSEWRKIKKRIPEIKKWASELCSDFEIASRLGLSKESFLNITHSHPELLIEIADSRKNFISEARDNLIKLTRGYEYKEKIIIFDVVNGKQSKAKNIRIIDRYLPPQVSAIEIFLKRFDPFYEDFDEKIKERVVILQERSEERKNKNERLKLLKG